VNYQSYPSIVRSPVEANRKQQQQYKQQQAFFKILSE